MNPQEILYILISIYVNHLSVTAISRKLGYSRNAIYARKKYFEDHKDYIIDVIDFINRHPSLKYASPSQLGKSKTAMKYAKTHDIKSHLKDVTYSMECEVRILCEEHLNIFIYQRNRNEFAHKILNDFANQLYIKYWAIDDDDPIDQEVDDDLLNAIKKQIYFYPKVVRSSFNLEFDDEKRFMRDVSAFHRYLRKPHHVTKNYQEVYEIFKAKHTEKSTIGYQAFYNVASQFVTKDNPEYHFFEDFIFDDDDDDEKKNYR